MVRGAFLEGFLEEGAGRDWQGQGTEAQSPEQGWRGEEVTAPGSGRAGLGQDWGLGPQKRGLASSQPDASLWLLPFLTKFRPARDMQLAVGIARLLSPPLNSHEIDI